MQILAYLVQMIWSWEAREKKKNVQDVRQISNRKTLELIGTGKWRSVWQSQNKRRILKMSKY